MHFIFNLIKTKTIRKHSLFRRVAILLIVFTQIVSLQAQHEASCSEIAFAAGSQQITLSSDGGILAISENKYTPSDTIIINYDGASVDNNRNISIWKDSNYPSVFYFPIDKHLLVRDYRNNDLMFAALDELMMSEQIIAALDTIEIIGACSPTGSEEYNKKLALSRCMALRSYLRQKHSQTTEDLPMKFNIIGIDKFGYNILKEQIPPLTEKQIWNRLQYAAVRLKMKDGSYITPGLDKPKPILIAPIIDEPVQIPRDTIFVKCDTVYVMMPQYIPVEEEEEEEEEEPKIPTLIYVALKTNLLYDAVLLPNLTFEWYIGNRWSLAIEGNWSWWEFDKPIQNRWFHRIQSAGIELRYWVKSPYPLHGHAIGIYSMIGNYDVRLLTKDEYSVGQLSNQTWSAGLSYSYSLPIAKRFNMEFGAAVGYVSGQYYKYDYCMKHEQWTKRSKHNRNYIGPTRLSVSLVWLLGSGNDEKSRIDYAERQRQKLFAKNK